ncbi:MAG: 2-amino-4-hydroxy-6-hydroxymethyldihydropteridine diphosphokinase [Prevotellaceae bacterium]|jgi:2-amino-4-hydroxy-6-hydroxymethyldihydropteridine diphosphokinase|nr:2-amino-4-hydroxy-6-hydroxymethyldihydropteridine diphosphokinase [Prevotellaceae bacterium]
MPILLLALGSNLGDKSAQIDSAVERIAVEIGHVMAIAPYMSSLAWGFVSEHTFLNTVVKVETSLDVWKVLEKTQAIERQLGRTQKSHNAKYADRIIDIDIIDYNQQIIKSSTLVLPHRQMHLRSFVLEPLCAIAPDWKHPLFELTAWELLDKLHKQTVKNKKSQKNVR